MCKYGSVVHNKVISKLVKYSPFDSQKFKFRAVILFLSWCQGFATITDYS